MQFIVYIPVPYYCPYESWHEDYLVDIIFPNYYFSGDIQEEKCFVEGLGEITSDDDPIIVMMKLKN